ncbi:nascent polypeptide-associated complex subunit beta [Cryptococcus wingfieldii CBS 7118]|uniref:Nascent polypeptide-associated complex subunit beta n=2 Tax=Cryptococcus TaxID=5206 RepID=A0A1E3IEV6_9TREE|nr:nascent polypeptide-associated complex subunit beta [Cryptococcus wingfieldii CBS 7118]ODN87123.1 nascent polypeptide-associated complex subunit beta [Cryptococcus wingfieldii CBS 7118]TYJ56234.1 nascent polypeptide-associated complex subunit beta [Cryptococcus floricola]
MDKEKLAKLQAQRLGGKGTPRRKVVKKSVTATQGDDRKLQAALKKLGVQPIAGVEEVNMFKEDGNVLHFAAPRTQVHAALPSNTLAIYGPGQTKELTELVPGILNQLGPDSLANLRKLAESYQSMTARQAAGAGGEGAGEGGDDEIPDLVDNFDEADVKKSDLEELE